MSTDENEQILPSCWWRKWSSSKMKHLKKLVCSNSKEFEFRQNKFN